MQQEMVCVCVSEREDERMLPETSFLAKYTYAVLPQRSSDHSAASNFIFFLKNKLFRSRMFFFTNNFDFSWRNKIINKFNFLLKQKMLS